MIRQHQRRAIGHRATTLLVAGSLLALAALIFAGCDRPAQQSGSDAAGTPDPSTMNLEWMVNGADAIVIGTVTKELEPSTVTRQIDEGARPTIVQDKYRNFAVEVAESFVPGLDTPATIAVRVQANTYIGGPIDPIPRAAPPLEFEVGNRVVLFLRHANVWAIGHESPQPPAGIEPRHYFGVSPYFHLVSTGPYEAGGLVWQDDKWVHLPSGDSVAEAELELAISEHASIVPSECLRISDRGDYAWIRTIREFMAQADVVIKGRMGGEVAARRGDAAVDVIEVVAGEIDSHEITLDGWDLKRPPGFDECEYYMFLTKSIPELFLDEGLPSERPGVYMLTGGPQGAFAVHAGLVEQGGLSLLDSEFRGIPDDDFREEILRRAAGPLIPAYSYSGAEGNGALLTGILGVNDRCLYVVDHFGTRWLPVFPPDAAKWIDGSLVLGPTGGSEGPLIYGMLPRFSPGQSIRLGGGETSADRLWNMALDQEPHHSCDTSHVWRVAPGGSMWLPLTPESGGR